MSQQIDLTLILPCFNEAEHLVQSVEAIHKVLSGSSLRYEIIFVEDKSSDNTLALLRELVLKIPNARLIEHEQNMGRGAAVKTGVRESQGNIIGFIDIDLEVAPYYMPALVGKIVRNECDVVIGHRYYSLRQTHNLIRHLLSRGYSMMCSLLLFLPFQDTESGYKFFRRALAKDLILSCEDNHWFFDTEVIARCFYANLTVHEVPVLFFRRYDKTSTVRLFSDTCAYLRAIFRFRKTMDLQLLGKSPIFWSSRVFELVMKLLYGKKYLQNYEAVARQVTAGDSVVEVCAGTGVLYREFLRKKARSYLGLDFNARFVMRMRDDEIVARVFDLRSEKTVPAADAVVMISSFCHFHKEADKIFKKLFAAASKKLIISEPVHNISQLPLGPIGWVLSWLSKPSRSSEYRFRYDEKSFRAFAKAHGATEFYYSHGDKNAIAVFQKP